MKRLWNFIANSTPEALYAAAKQLLFERAAARLLCCLLVIAALLLYWLNTPAGEVSFVYNAF
jgi:hypothetical protein